ncbi:MAG: carbohydrate ABC transporter permease [Lentisphaeria bacterium]|nr:carbohydrate ABC transporter permease [Lentisphaeria bacterium]
MSSESKKYFYVDFSKTFVFNVILIGFSLSFILPFVWMLFTSVKPLDQVENDSWIPLQSAWITEADFNKPEEFLQQLVDHKDPISAYLWEHVSPSMRDILNEAKEEGTLSNTQKYLPAISNDLSAIMKRHNFQANEAFAQIEMTKDMTRIKDDNEAWPLLNRYYLDAYYVGHFKEPRKYQWYNYLKVFENIPYARYYWNTIFVAAWVTFLQVLTSSMAAFSFARLSWKGRDKVFVLYLATMMLPGLVMMIPNYQIMVTLGLVDSLPGLIIPSAFSTFGCFMLRQFMLGISPSLDEAAEIDGASKWQLYWEVILPLTKPGLVTLAIFTFMGNYHSFFWPLVMLRSQNLYTLPIGLLAFDGSSGQETNLLMAAVGMSVIPMIFVFVFFQKQLVNGIQLGGVKE